MKPEYLLTINREGKFSIEFSQYTNNQCGKVGQQEYSYFCSIAASSKSLTREGYVMENLWTDQYFQNLYGYSSRKDGVPVPSCEQMAMDAIDYFRMLFKKHDELKKVDLRRIYVRIHGSPVSFIECEWRKTK